MSYLYSSLKNALGGKGFKSGVVLNDWTPNEVRAIFIMKDFILIADYLKPPKLYPLDVEMVRREIAMPALRRGNLNKLLENRQLSCMEEIYVDDELSSEKDIIDLDNYVSNNYGQVSRLRYYGYVYYPLDRDALMNLYSQALINGNMDFTVANMIEGSKDTGNTDWYKKYNLRPQYYTLDKERGKLHTYFAKCESVIGSALLEKEAATARKSVEDWIFEMFSADLKTASDIVALRRYINHCKNCDDFARNVGFCIEKHLSAPIKVKGLTRDMLLRILRDRGVDLSGAVKFMLSTYKNCSVYDTDDNPSALDISGGITGFYNLKGRLDSAMGEVVSTFSGGANLLMFLLASKRNNKGLPRGKLVDALSKKSILLNNPTEDDNLEGLLQYAYGVCGYKYSEYKEFILANN